MKEPGETPFPALWRKSCNEIFPPGRRSGLKQETLTLQAPSALQIRNKKQSDTLKITAKQSSHLLSQFCISSRPE